MSEFSDKIIKMGWNFPHPGGLDGIDIDSIKFLVDSLATPNMKIVDVGCWTGMSTVALALACKKYNGSVISVDWFKGSPNTGLEEAAKEMNIKELYLANIRYFNLKNTSCLNMRSEEAVEKFDNDSCDLVFIDADHKYKAVKKDISLWYPKVKKGGIICGHDCEFILPDKKSEWDILALTDTNPWNNEDYLSFHIGVVRAVSQKFPNAKREGNRVWWTVKN